MNIPFGVIINRTNIGDEKVEAYCQEKDIPILMRIPFDKEIAFLYSRGIPIVQEKKEYMKQFRELYDCIRSEKGVFKHES